MSKIFQIYNKIRNQDNLSIDEAIDFINEVYPKISGKSVDPSITVKALQSGLGNQIISYCCNYILENPLEFNLEISKLTDRNGKIIKIYIKEII